MGCVTHVSTLSEKKIATNLPLARAKIFLETRYYIRDALSYLFNLEPLKIKINAEPGKPPKLPKGFGYISISHCKDAFIIVWHQEKIGIDIERSDRNFNYKNLAKKYFCKENVKNYNLNRYAILQKWSAVEAAIKYDRGKLSEDINEWKLNNNKEQLFHNTKKIALNLTQFAYLDWTISIAYNNKAISEFPKIICNNL